jgi:hypothetical protein
LSAEDVAKNGNRNGNANGNGSAGPDVRPTPNNVPRPSSRYASFQEGGLFRVQVPDNWREMPGNNAVTFAPEGAYGSVNGQGVFTHGVQIGVARNEEHDLQTATGELIQSLRQGNPRLRQASNYGRTTVAGRQGLTTQLSNVSDVTGGEERILVATTLLQDGTLFYVLGVAPRADYNSYGNVFSKIVRSIQLTK